MKNLNNETIVEQSKMHVKSEFLNNVNSKIIFVWIIFVQYLIINKFLIIIKILNNFLINNTYKYN